MMELRHAHMWQNSKQNSYFDNFLITHYCEVKKKKKTKQKIPQQKYKTQNEKLVKNLMNPSEKIKYWRWYYTFFLFVAVFIHVFVLTMYRFRFGAQQ